VHRDAFFAPSRLEAFTGIEEIVLEVNHFAPAQSDHTDATGMAFDPLAIHHLQVPFNRDHIAPEPKQVLHHHVPLRSLAGVRAADSGNGARVDQNAVLSPPLEVGRQFMTVEGFQTP